MVMVRKIKKGEKIPGHHVHFPTFFNLMLEDMDDNFPEKGDSWIEDDTFPYAGVDPNVTEIPVHNSLVMGLEDVFHKFMENGDTTYLKKIANYCAMIDRRKTIRGE